jgi:putative chitinase
MISLNQLQGIMPYAGKRAELFLAPINKTIDEFHIITPIQQAAFLANLCHESGSLRYTEEIASGAAYDNRADLGNTLPEAVEIAKQHNSTPGRWWKGHGLIQVTGYSNHLDCGKDLDLDLLDFPVLLTLPLNAARSAGWFWHKHDLNAIAYSEDFDGVCDVINRGHKTVKVGDANGYKDRLDSYVRALAILI